MENKMDAHMKNLEKEEAEVRKSPKGGGIGAVIAGIGAIAIGMIMAISLLFTPPVPVGNEAVPAAALEKGYDSHIAVFVGRPTVVYVWDYAAIDGDVAGINGVAIPIDATPKRIVLPPGIPHVVLTAVKDGHARGITPMARSEAGSITKMNASPGESVIIPTVPVL
jgi:hypothetical protein